MSRLFAVLLLIAAVVAVAVAVPGPKPVAAPAPQLLYGGYGYAAYPAYGGVAYYG